MTILGKPQVLTDIGELKDITTEHSTQLEDRSKLTFEDIYRSILYQILKNSNKATMVGDSITQGTTNGGHGWYEYMQSYFPNCTFVNKGVGGDTTKKVLDRFADILSTNADTYIIAIGTNDVRYRDPSICAMTSTEYVTNITSMVNQIKSANPNANIVIINAWCAFNADYTSVLDLVERDAMLDDYNSALRKYCSTVNIPFIDANVYIKKIINFANKSSFLLDYIHPNATLGIKLYSNAVLFGEQKIEDYNLSPTKTSAKYLYKLEINNYAELTNLSIGVPLVGIWSNVSNSGHDNISNIIDQVGESYVFKPKSSSNVPTIIIFSTNLPIIYLRYKALSDNLSVAITDCKIYESSKQENILNFGYSNWNIVKAFKTTVYKQTLYIPDLDLTSLVTFESGWGYRSGKVPIIRIKDEVLYLSFQIQKSSKWTIFEKAFTINKALFIPNDTWVINSYSFIASSGGVRTVASVIDYSGNVFVGWRDSNTQNDDCISFSASIPLG